MTALHRPHPYWFWIAPAVLATLLLIVYFGELNLPLFRLGNTLSLYTGDWFWANITLFGDTLLVFVLLLPFVARRPGLIWAMLLSACVVTLVVHLGKYAINSPRPVAVLEQGGVHLIGFVAYSSSFPSGHTAAAFTLATCITRFPLHWRWKVTTIVMALMVGVSRIAVGIHWPLDVIGGALVGWLGGGLGCYLAPRLRFGLGLMAQRLQAGLLLLLAGICMGLHDGGYPDGRPLLVLLPVVMVFLALPGLKQLFSTTGLKREQ